jgi:bacteriocin biosynthesis cyclodehydratase domain-containing protein
MANAATSNVSAGDAALLAFPPRFQLVRLATGSYRLVSLTESLRLELAGTDGSLLDAVAPLLARGATREEIEQAAGVGHRIEVETLLAELGRNALLQPLTTASDAESAGDEQRRFLANFLPLEPPGVPEAEGRRLDDRIAAATVAVVGLGERGSQLAHDLALSGVGTLILSSSGTSDSADQRAGRLAAELERDGATRCSIGEANLDDLGSGEASGPDLTVLCEDGFDSRTYERLNRLCIERRLTWTSFRDLGNRFEVGPTVIPFETACFRCYELRRASNDDQFELWAETASMLAAQGRGVGSLKLSPGVSLLAVEVLKILSGFSRPMTRSAVFSFDLLRFEAQLHPVLKIPRCQACGAAARGQPAWRVWGGDSVVDAT